MSVLHEKRRKNTPFHQLTKSHLKNPLEGECFKWLPVLTAIRTDPELRVRIIQHKINRGHSEFLERIAA